VDPDGLGKHAEVEGCRNYGKEKPGNSNYGQMDSERGRCGDVFGIRICVIFWLYIFSILWRVWVYRE
jgi:hypothetical protein